MAQTVRSIRPYTDRVIGAGKNRPAEGLRQGEHPPYTPETQAAVGGRLEKPQVAGIEHLQVLTADDRKDQTSSTGSESQ
jgi:hypothetical protein